MPSPLVGFLHHLEPTSVSDREVQYSPSQEYTKRHLIRAINLSMGSNFIAETPHPPKEKYFTLGGCCVSASEIFLLM